MRSILAVLILALFLNSCTEKKSDPVIHATNDSTKEQQTFFPVTEYIRGQLNEIDSLPVTPLKIIWVNGKTDSVWMKKQDIRTFAEPFLHPLIDTSNLKQMFTESSFLDQTIDAFTFSYDPVGKLPDTMQLRRWDVYIDPMKNTIKRIYILKQTLYNNKPRSIQLTWKGGAWCQVTTITEQDGGQPDIRTETMKWDLTDD